MARVQVYLADELHRRIKELELSPSELLQRAARDEIRRRELAAAAEQYLAELAAEVGEPSAADVRYARDFVGRLNRDDEQRAG